jgi:short-subunit dehydrogenase
MDPTRNQDHPARPRALVTGASAGIGAAFAGRLAREGYDLIVVARDGERLEALARLLSEQHGVQVEVLVADLADAAALRTVEERIAAVSRLDLLVNNAGIGYWSPFVEISSDRAELEIRVNVIAVTRIAHAALPGMIARGRGALINVSSSLAFRPVPNFTVYCGTKAYINTFSQSLHNELAGTGVQVQLLSPGRTRSEFYQRSGRDFSTLPAATFMEPDDVVQASLAGLRLGELFCMPGLHDYELLTRVLERQGDISQNSTADTLASRYTDASSMH